MMPHFFWQHPIWQKVLITAFYVTLALLTGLFLVPTELLPEDSIFAWWDKAQHALVFGFLALLGLLAYPTKIKTIFWGLLIYGALIEVLQSLLGWRSGDVYDWCADAIGIVLAYSGALIVRMLFLSRYTMKS